MRVGTWFLQQLRDIDSNWHVIAMVLFALFFGLISGIFVTVICFLRNPRIIRTYYLKVKSSIEAEQRVATSKPEKTKASEKEVIKKVEDKKNN